MLYFFMAIFAFANILTGEIAKELNFQDLLIPNELIQVKTLTNNFPEHLIQLDGCEVKIRGFLYTAESDQLILSPQPNLKSCCIGSGEKATQQIFITGDLDKKNNHTALTLKGRFFIDPKWDEKGSLKQIYRLEQVRSISEKHHRKSAYFFISLGILLSIGVIIYLFWKEKRHKIV